MPFTLYLLALATFVMGTSEFMLAGLVPDIATDLDVGVGTAGLLTSAFAVGMVVGAPVMAAFGHRRSPRGILLVCVVAFAISHVVGAISPTFAILCVTRVISALANAGFLAVALSTAATLVPAHRQGRAVAILLSGTTIAMVAGVPAGALIGNTLGWRTTFWIIAALCIPALVGILRGVPAPVSHVAPRGTPVHGLASELRQLGTARLLLPMLLGALINGGTFAAFTFLAPIVIDTAGMDEHWVSITLIVFGVGSFIGITVAGRLSDRHPRLVITIGGPLLLAGWIGLACLAAHPIALIGLVFLQGVVAFGVGSTLIARVLAAATAAPTLGGAYATAALNVGAAAGPACAAAALGTGMGTLAPVWVAAMLTATALVIAVTCAHALAARPPRE